MHLSNNILILDKDPQLIGQFLRQLLIRCSSFRLARSRTKRGGLVKGFLSQRNNYNLLYRNRKKQKQILYMTFTPVFILLAYRKIKRQKMKAKHGRSHEIRAPCFSVPQPFDKFDRYSLKLVPTYDQTNQSYLSLEPAAFQLTVIRNLEPSKTSCTCLAG